MSIEYGPDKPCQRTQDDRCPKFGPHLGGAHIDQRHKLYDGPHTTLNALPHKARDAAFKLIHGGASMPEVVDMAQVIHAQRDRIGHLMVDKDRSVQAASERALDCTEHGKAIADLENQVHYFDGLAEKNDKARIALLGLLYGIEEAVSTVRQRRQLGQELPSTEEFVEVLAKTAKRARDAHQRAWKS